MTHQTGPTPEQLAEAEAVLYHMVETVDPGTGEVTRRRVETPLYSYYLTHRAAHEAARAAYAGAHQEAQSTPTGKRTWPMLASTLQLPVKQAYDRWRAGGADKVERALAILERGPSHPAT